MTHWTTFDWIMAAVTVCLFLWLVYIGVFRNRPRGERE